MNSNEQRIKDLIDQGFHVSINYWNTSHLFLYNNKSVLFKEGLIKTFEIEGPLGLSDCLTEVEKFIEDAKI